MINNFSPSLTFEIINSDGFFKKLLSEYADFNKDYINPRFALNCALNSWHLTDWTFQEFFKNDLRFQDSFEKSKKGDYKVSGLSKYQNFIVEKCEELKYMRLISNGTKHCILNKAATVKTATKIGDFKNSDWSRHDFDTTRFIIELENGEKIGFEKILLKTIDFWRLFLNDLYKSDT